MRCLIFGAQGWVGSLLADAIPGALRTATRIDDARAVGMALDQYHPDRVINAAGRVGRPNVDWCEDHVHETWRGNVTGPAILAEACAKRGIHLTHMGSGCVYLGQSPHADGAWRERDVPNATSIYARSKAAGDLLLGHLPGVAVVRIRMPVSRAPNPRSLPDKLASYTTLCDATNSVTFLADLPDVVMRVAQAQARGIFHAVNPGVLTHREIVAAWRELVDPTLPDREWVNESELRRRGLARAERSHVALADTRLHEVGAMMRKAAWALREDLACRVET